MVELVIQGSRWWWLGGMFVATNCMLLRILSANFAYVYRSQERQKAFYCIRYKGA